MAQTLRPISNVTIGPWQANATGNYWYNLTVETDAEYIWNDVIQNSPYTAAMGLPAGSVKKPNQIGTYMFSYRVGKTYGKRQVNCTVRLKDQNNVTIKSYSHVDLGGLTTFNQIILESELEGISDWNQIRFEVGAIEVGGGQPAVIQCSWTKFVIPDNIAQIAIKVGGAWKDMTATKIQIGGAWKTVLGVKQQIGGVWKTVM